MATKHDVYEALRAHFAKRDTAPTQDQLSAAVGSPWTAVKQHLLRLKTEGVVAWEPGDYSTLRLTAKTPRADKNSPNGPQERPARRPRGGAPSTIARSLTRPRAAAPAPAAASTPAPGLEGAIAVTYDAEEIEQLAALEQQLRAAADQIGAIVAALRTSPPLGPLGASLFQFLAQARASGQG